MTKIQVQKDQHRVIQLTKPGEYVVELTGPGAHAEIQGAFYAKDQQKINIHLQIVHQVARTSAKTTLRGVADDLATIHFFGQIKIASNCPQTQSFLEERILLLSDQAHAEAIPELEILSNDVKCSHAVSVSHIPSEQLFYLMSRGLSRLEAIEQITQGFLNIPLLK